MGAPETIRNFEFASVLLTSQKHIQIFLHFSYIGAINEQKTKISDCFSELNI